MCIFVCLTLFIVHSQHSTENAPRIAIEMMFDSGSSVYLPNGFNGKWKEMKTHILKKKRRKWFIECDQINLKQFVLMFHITRILFGNKTFATVFNGSDTWYTEYVPILKCLPLQTDSPFYNWYLKIVIIELNSSLVAVGPVRCAPTDKLKHFFSSENIFKMIRRPQHIQFKLCSGMSKERHLFECFSVFGSRWITADVILLTLNSDALVPGFLRLLRKSFKPIFI